MDVQHKKIGLFSAVIIQTNAMIGAGVVAIPAILAQTTGSLGLLAYVACILIIFCMTVSLGELSLLHGGGVWCYHFPSLWGKHRIGILASSLYVIGILISMGFVSKQAGIWLHEMLPFLNFRLLAVAITGVLSLFVYAGKNVSSLWQYVISAIIFLGILVITTLCFAHFDEKIFLSKGNGSSSSMIVIAPILLFSLLGFETISSLYAIVKKPRQNVLLGGIIGVSLVGLLYIVFSSSVIGSIELSYFRGAEEQSLAMILTNAFPKFHYLSKIVYLGGLFAIIGTLHSVLWSISILFLGVLKKSKNRRTQAWITKGKITTDQTLGFACLAIIGSSFLTSTFIMNMAVLFIATSYVLSIIALLHEKTHKVLNRLICMIGIFGGCLMGAFALYSLIHHF